MIRPSMGVSPQLVLQEGVGPEVQRTDGDSEVMT